MNRTKIEWCDFTWNPVVGCKNGCYYCYAKKIINRFEPNIPFTQIRNYDERLNQPLKQKLLSRIFVGSMTDLFASWAHPFNVLNILNICEQSKHTFLFLTKSPHGYYQYKFPDNCWLGITIDTQNQASQSEHFSFLNNKHFLSIEPLLEDVDKYIDYDSVNWVIIGGLNPHPIHQKEWVDKIINSCRREHIPIFLKSNLHYHKKIQEIAE